MDHDSLFSHLLRGDTDKSFSFLEEALKGGKDLVYFLDEVLFTAASVKYKNENLRHLLQCAVSMFLFSCVCVSCVYILVFL